VLCCLTGSVVKAQETALSTRGVSRGTPPPSSLLLSFLSLGSSCMEKGGRQCQWEKANGSRSKKF